MEGKEKKRKEILKKTTAKYVMLDAQKDKDLHKSIDPIPSHELLT